MSKREAIVVNQAFFERLWEISQQMAHIHSLNTLLERAMRAALDMLNAERGYLMLIDAQDNYSWRIQRNRDGSSPQAAIPAEVLRHRWHTDEPVLFGDAQHDLYLSMGVPLMTKSRLLGALYLEVFVHGFQPSDLVPFRLFARQLTLALHRVLALTALEERARQRTAELEQAVQYMERAWLDAVESNRIRTLILANIAHDMRSPIGLSISTLQTIREGSLGALNEQQIIWLDRVLETLHHVINLTGDVFDLTKAELSGLQLNLAATDMQRFMVHLSQLGEGIDWAPNVAFEVIIPADLPVLIIDATRIQQVVFNLLSNAQRFTSEGRVQLYAERREHDLLIGVRDSGVGIPSDQREVIFERFHQGNQESATRFRGTGLGLTISRELVLLHGGRIWVESEVGRYSDFKFTLPLVPAN